MTTKANSTLTVAHEELVGSPRVEMTPEGGRGVRDLKCAWDDRHRLTEQLLGLADPGDSDDFGSGTIRRPHQMPGHPSMVATSVGIEPFDSKVQAAGGFPPGEGVASYTYAKLSVKYETKGWSGQDDSDDGGPLFEETFDPAVQFIKVPGRKLYWDAEPDAETGTREALDAEDAPGLMLRTYDYKVTIEGVTRIPSAVFSLIGSVNDGQVVSDRYGMTFAVGTLLYTPPKIRTMVFADGRKSHSLDFGLTYKPSGWNKFFKPGEADPQPIYDADGTEVKFYPEASFAPIFSLLGG